MDARERWQALQARLTSARAAVDAGDREKALAEITAALDLDKDFLAAHALRDRILTLGSEPAARPAPLASPAPPRAAPGPARVPGISTDGYAKFEQRAKRRRVDRRIEAARAALDQQRLKAAASALDEVIELDPNLPELTELTARFDELRRATATTHRGPWIAAAAVFAAALLGGSWLQESSPTIFSRQIVVASPLPAPLIPDLTIAAASGPAEAAEPAEPVGTAGGRDARVIVPVRMIATSPVGATALATAPALPPPVARVTTAGLESAPSLPVETTAAPEPVALAPPVAMAAVVPVSNPVPPKVEGPDDSVLVKQALQRYRTAYEGLDARSARAVWPAVNEAALARAFDGLESQSLTFEACDVRLRGEAATATCHGSARYVTKIGSRDPRIEPRVWNFTLRKSGSDWKIDSARAER